MPEKLNTEERMALLKNMVEADPENDLAHFSLGKLQLEARDLAEAERSFRRVLEVNPRHSVAHLFLGMTLADGGRKEEAAAVLAKGVLLAHEEGEFQPRNRMQELLRSLGAEPPDPAKTERIRRGAKESDFACSRCGLSNPRLEEPPFENEMGRKIHESICTNCWREWLALSIKVINEYRLNLATEQGSQIFDSHMKEFFGLRDDA